MNFVTALFVYTAYMFSPLISPVILFISLTSSNLSVEPEDGLNMAIYITNECPAHISLHSSMLNPFLQHLVNLSRPSFSITNDQRGVTT